jgi:hypothetical protein
MRVIGLALPALLSLVSEVSFAQDEGGGTGFEAGCGRWYTYPNWGCIIGQHAIAGPEQEWVGRHSDCWTCPGDDCHPICDRLPSPESTVAYRAAIEAAGNGDTERLIRLAKQLPSMIVFESSRNAIQLLACDGTTVAASLFVAERYRRSGSALRDAKPAVQAFMLMAAAGRSPVSHRIDPEKAVAFGNPAQQLQEQLMRAALPTAPESVDRH